MERPRPVSPSYHLQFSEALGNFALYAARRIVEAHHGQLIYAGGDDVLAMLPADEAIACAQGLRMAFQGDRIRPLEPGCPHPENSELPQKYPAQFQSAPSGFIRLADPLRSEPTWPLLVPGPAATVSVGIAIGHIKEPLQDMVQAAQQAEKRAKRAPEKGGHDRNALAVNLFKRSGEQIEWGAKFDSKVFALLELLRREYRAPVDNPKKVMPISGKFPYRVAALLRPYATEKLLTPEVRDIAVAELGWAIQQLESDQAKAELRRCAEDYLNELTDKRPLADFYDLFAVEAFIARQGE